jgi:hypothetical protein
MIESNRTIHIYTRELYVSSIVTSVSSLIVKYEEDLHIIRTFLNVRSPLVNLIAIQRSSNIRFELVRLKQSYCRQYFTFLIGVAMVAV